EPQRAAYRCVDRRYALRPRGFSRQLLAQSRLVVSELRRDRRNRSRSWIHRSGGCVGVMVPGSKRTHYRDRGWRIRSGCAYNRSGGDKTDPERRRVDYIRLPRYRLSGCYSYFRRVHAKPARWLEAGRLVAIGFANVTTRWARFHFERSAQDLAVVRALVVTVSKYVRGHFCYLAGSADLSGIDRSE